MESIPGTGVRIFEARTPSVEGKQMSQRFFLIAAAFIVAPAVLVWLLAAILPSFVPWLVTGILVPIALFFLVLGFFLTSMGNKLAAGVHYELTDTDLTLIGGPVRYIIPRNTIRRVYTRDLDMSLSNRPPVRATAVRMPNLALADVQYKDTGPLKMCATSSWERITIIETDALKYGATPADEQGFKTALGVAG